MGKKPEGRKGRIRYLPRGKRWHLARSSRGWTLNLLSLSLSLFLSPFYILYCGLTMINSFVAIHKTLGTKRLDDDDDDDEDEDEDEDDESTRRNCFVLAREASCHPLFRGEAIERTSYWRARSQLDASPRGIEYFWTCPLCDGRITGEDRAARFSRKRFSPGC